GDQPVGLEGQVRPVSLAGAERKDRDPVRARRGRKGRIVVLPTSRGSQRHGTRPFRARRSMSCAWSCRQRVASVIQGGSGETRSGGPMGKKKKEEKKEKSRKKEHAAIGPADVSGAVVQAARSVRTVLSRNLL